MALVAGLAQVGSPASAAVDAGEATTQATPQAVSQYIPFNAAGTIDVQGRGYGHGRGMSQWGAQGAALQGRSAEQIVSFYYPGTGRNNIGNPTVRVLLTAPSNAQQATFTPRAGGPQPSVTTTDGRTLRGQWLTVRAEGSALRAEVRATAGGAVVDSGEVPSGATISTDAGVLLGAGVAPASATWYRGSIVITNTSGFQVVNHLPMQQYLYGVVPRESPAWWEPAALQAQAIAARSYQQSTAKPTATNDTCDTTQCQVYGGRELIDLKDGRRVQGESASTTAAVDATAGLIVTRSATDKRAAFTQFSSSSGGYSVAGSADHPYLVAQPDPYSGTAPKDTVSRWTAQITADNASKHCPAGGRATGVEVTGRDGRGEFGGRITGLTVHCTNGATEITTEFSRRLGLRSSWWASMTPASIFFLSNSLGSAAEIEFEFGPRGTTDVFVGDWDGDGVTGIGYRQGNMLYLRQTPDAGAVNPGIAYGRPGDAVLVGDWDGNGTETVGVRRGNTFYLKNTIGGGNADLAVPYGRPGDEVLVGDWNGDGKDTPGVRRGNIFYLKNSWTGGDADIVVAFGRPGDQVVVGDWKGTRKDTPAVRRGNTFYLQPDFVGGNATTVVAFGRATDRVLVGDWDGDGKDTLGLHRLVY